MSKIKTSKSPRLAPVRVRFRVSLERLLPDPRIRNPFLIRNWEGLESKVLVRTWEFAAESAAEVLRLLDEAKQAGEPQVQAMRIRSIVEVSPNESSSATAKEKQ